MKQFIKQFTYFSLIIIIPFITLFSLYLYFDPFKILYKYSNYNNSKVASNRDYVSTTMFLQNYSKYHYNSFIFGSSRTLGLTPSSWKKHLVSSDIPFSFDASSESLYGIYKKILFLDSKNVKIKNAIILLENDCSFKDTSNNLGMLTIKHPVLTGESYFDYNMVFLKSYYNVNFLFSFYSYKLLNEIRPYMKMYIDDRDIYTDSITNELKLISLDKEIELNTNSYYNKRKHIFYNRVGEIQDTVEHIGHRQMFMLNNIRNIFEKQNTKYYIILSPLYSQIKFSKKDLLKLEKVFGKDCVYDYTGKNLITDSRNNYYETAHFRPIVGEHILNIIYINKLINK